MTVNQSFNDASEILRFALYDRLFARDYLIGQLKELPGVLTQDETVEEVKDNICDALALYLEDMREDESEDNSADIIAREELEFV